MPLNNKSVVLAQKDLKTEREKKRIHNKSQSHSSQFVRLVPNKKTRSIEARSDETILSDVFCKQSLSEKAVRMRYLMRHLCQTRNFIAVRFQHRIKFHFSRKKKVRDVWIC